MCCVEFESNPAFISRNWKSHERPEVDFQINTNYTGGLWHYLHVNRFSWSSLTLRKRLRSPWSGCFVGTARFVYRRMISCFIRNNSMKCRGKSDYVQHCAAETNILQSAALCITLILWQRSALCVRESEAKSFVFESGLSLGINSPPYVEENHRSWLCPDIICYNYCV